MDPWIVEISRGERVESSSLGHGIVMNADGETLLSFGDLQRETFPRSAAKWKSPLPELLDSWLEAGAFRPDRVE